MPEGSPQRVVPKTPKKVSEKFLPLMRSRYEIAYDADKDNREAALEDLKFRAGEQYTEQDKKVREGRPLLTIDRTGQFVRQVTGDIRLNTPQGRVRPVGDGADQETAETLEGLIRNIQYVSRARLAYLSAADSMCTCGIGHFRINREYSSDDTFEQDIRIRRMPDVFSVTWDPQAEEFDKSDAMYCFVTRELSDEEFEEQYPKAAKISFEEFGRHVTDTKRYELWRQDKVVVVGEYWVKEPTERTISLLSDGRVIDDADTLDPLTRELLDAGGLKIKDTRVVKTHKVNQYIVNGAEVLEGPFEWPTGDIPIIPVIGEEIHVGRRLVRQGMVRALKDPQRAYNLMRSAQVEWLAMQPKAPYAATAKQIEGHEDNWKKVANENFPVLIYNPDPDAPGPPQRVAPPTGSVGFAQEIAQCAEDMKAVTGVFDASLGARGNETSGVAIQARQREGDVSTFNLVDNVALAIETCCRQLVRLIPKVYDTERVVRVLFEDGSDEARKVNGYDDQGQKVNFLTDISDGKYDVVVDTGPSFSTRRQEAAASMQDIVRAAPDLMSIGGDLLVKNLDWPGADDLAERLKRHMMMTSPHLLMEDEQFEAFLQQPKPPTPEDIEAMAEAEKIALQKREQDRKDRETDSKVEGQELDNTTKAIDLWLQSGQLESMIGQVVRAEVIAALMTAAQPVSAQPDGLSSSGQF